MKKIIKCHICGYNNKIEEGLELSTCPICLTDLSKNTEEVVDTMTGAYTNSKKMMQAGKLILTNKRILWIKENGVDDNTMYVMGGLLGILFGSLFKKENALKLDLQYTDIISIEDLKMGSTKIICLHDKNEVIHKFSLGDIDIWSKKLGEIIENNKVL